MGIWISSNAFWNEPSRTVDLLTLNDKKLESHKEYDDQACHLVCFLIKEIVRVHLEIERHEALHGKERHCELHRWSFARTFDVTVHNLRDP